jgi:hypothetical protein
MEIEWKSLHISSLLKTELNALLRLRTNLPHRFVLLQYHLLIYSFGSIVVISLYHFSCGNVLGANSATGSSPDKNPNGSGIFHILTGELSRQIPSLLSVVCGHCTMFEVFEIHGAGRDSSQMRIHSD